MIDEIITVTKPKAKFIPHRVDNEELTLWVHTDESIFPVLSADWERLARLSNQMVCMSPGWAASWWKYFGRHTNRFLCIVTVHDNDRLVGILPLYRGVTKLGGITLQKRLQLIGSGGNQNEQLGFSDDYGVSDFLDVIVDPEYSTRTAKLFVKLLTSAEFADYAITFHQARDDSYVKQTLCPLLEKQDHRLRIELSDTCPFIVLNQTKNLKDFIKKSKSNARRRFRQTLRARGAENEYVIEEPAGLDEVDQMLEKLMQLHQEKWNANGYPGAFQDRRFRAFFKEISFDAYHENRLWLKQAVDKSGVCAVRMLLMYNGRYYDYMSGYDENSSSVKYRPGIGLLLDLIENSLAMPVERIELLRGDEGYKNDFTQFAMKNWKITIPQARYWKTSWGVPAAMIQFFSVLHKYFIREKTLLKVQYDKVGAVHMASEYYKFRLVTLRNKLNRLSESK